MPHPGHPTTARVLAAHDVAALRAVLAVFAEGFGDDATYRSKPPSDDYLGRLLADGSFLAIAGCAGDTIVGGLAGYVLRKFEQERSEFYIYDLAVLAAHRRRGVATAMIECLQRWAADHGVHVIFVQADYGDDPAVTLYTQLGTREDVMHFDIAPAAAAASGGGDGR